ncbi:hypothetical protein [Jannaschia sp. W003]|uniref:hypothetical protein n=1 Tax=Jannaschia sp. W003 TaxID=2867012 RepID=UPI0021A365FF|nr:hypothetical protein [Jannaschia sp. W003]UWQ21577.1 hypothetical protein K3554_00650 [Jannaschia sp. W003]
MPNTLGHLGIQTLATRGVLRNADVKWIWLACILPDLPWIGQRVARAALPGTDPIDLRLYAIVQSSLAFAVLLSLALACFSRQLGRCFAILAGGSALHLVLDAMQTKWGNGVVLWAPVRWDLLNVGLFWPEDAATAALTLLGLVVGALALWRSPKSAGDLRLPGRGGALLAALAGGLYLVGPAALTGAAEAADLHSAATLRPGADRAGRAVAFDRARLEVAPGGDAVLHVWTGDAFAVAGTVPERSGQVSVRGVFRDARTVELQAVHAHPDGLRDMASYVGLALVAGFWLLCLVPRRRT